MKKPIPFGKYLLLERVNVGGMAEVFKAKAFGVEGFERLVALKRILPSIAEDTEFIKMFIDEAKIAVQLTHANVAQIFDLGKVGDSYFIAMEYVRGRDLRAIFDRARKRGEPLPVPMACYVTMKVCEGLDYAHNKRNPAGRDMLLVHRDVSPQNVLLSHDGEVKIIDFGIAKAVGKASKTQAGILKGKFGYMSPEQVRGLPLDRRSDVFAVGICLYEVLTGERLFVGESDFSTLEKVRNVEIMPPSTYNRRIPEELEQIVLKALAKDVDDRYQTAMDLHDDLQSFMYTSGNFFARKDLSAYMRKGFAEEIAKESARDEKYDSLEMPRGSGLDAFDGLPAAGGRAANVSAPGRMPKRTMMGMGAVPPPPPSGRVSVPGARPPPPPPRSSGPPPLRPSNPGPSANPPANMGAPSLDMDWDDEELSTQIYDKPDAMAAMASGGPGAAGPTMPDPLQPSSSSPAGPRPPASAPPSAGPPTVTPRPSLRQVGPTPAPRGAPSPFEPGTTGPTPGPRLPAKERREPTAVTRASKDGRGPLAAVVGAFLVLLVAGIAAGVWFGVLAGDPGTIQLTTTPPDPVVRFDEQPVPATSSPFVIPNVEPGTIHLLEVRKTGYRPWSMQVEVQSGQTLVLPPVSLQREGGGDDATPAVAGATPTGTGFSLSTEPSGAKVFIDGAEIEQRTPVTLTELAVGSHTIRVENGARYAPWETQVDVRADTVIPLQAELELARITVSFISEPSGATVTLIRGSARRNVGRTPTSADVDLLGEGAWEVELELSGHEPVTRAITPVAGEDELELEIALEPRRVAVRTPRVATTPRPRPTPTPTPTPRPVMRDPAPATGNGTLRVNTRPWSQVFVDGQLIGNTPQMNIPLSAGSHRLTLVNSEFNIRETVSVQVRPGEVTTKIITLTPGG